MNAESLSQFLAMGGYGLYVWGSMGMCALVFGLELASLRSRRRALAREICHEAPPAPLRQPVLSRQEGQA